MICSSLKAGAILSQVSTTMGPLPVISRNCLGFAFRLTGQNRVPDPPAMMTTYILDHSEFVSDSKAQNNDSMKHKTRSTCLRPGRCFESGSYRLAGYSKTLRYKAPDNLYPPPAGRGMRRTVQYVAVTRDEGNAVDGRFSATCYERMALASFISRSHWRHRLASL